MNTPIKPVTHLSQYITNPFKIIIDSITDGFNRNQNPVIALIVGGILVGSIQQIPNLISNVSSLLDGSDTSSPMEPVVAIIVILLIGIASIVSIIVSGIWTAFTSHVGLANAHKLQTTIAEGRKVAFRKFVSVLAIQFITWLISSLWFIPAVSLFVTAVILQATQSLDTPAVVLYIMAAVAFLIGLFFSLRTQISRSLAVFALLDGASGSIDAMRQSKNLTKNRLIEAMGLTFICTIVPFVGPALYALSVGAYFVQLKGYRSHGAELPPTHILSWLPIMLAGGIVLLIGILAAVIAAVALAN